jgi:Undecaprenyl-phosphate glucose phosphotransferase
VIRKHQRWINVMIALSDALILLLAYAGALFSKQGDASFAQNYHLYAATPLWLIPLCLLVYYLSEVYVPMRGTTYRKEALLIIRAHLLALGCAFAVLYLFKIANFSRQVFIVFGLLGLFLLLVERGLLRRTLKRLRSIGYNKKYVLIVGAGRKGQSFAKRMMKNRHFGYSLLGFLDDNPSQEGQRFFSRPVMGKVSDLPSILATTTVDMVVAALPSAAYNKYSKLVRWCDDEGVRLRVIPDYYDIFVGQSRIEEFDGIPLLNIRYVALDEPVNRALKRTLDLVVSMTAILVTTPLMLLIAAGIKLASPGPVFFRQTRVGFNGREFSILKFRTMRVANNPSDSTWTTSGDPRKFPFGKFLRKTSLDELPQFFNVLSGDMSVVGPRPERPHFVQQFKRDIPKYMIKHQVKPGITGWAQINGWRGDTSIAKRIEFDIHYIENWDIFFDIKILFLTLFRGFINKNAY